MGRNGNLLLTDHHTADSMVHRLGIGPWELKGLILERGVRRDQVDRLQLDDLVAEDIHQAAPLEAGPHPAG